MKARHALGLAALCLLGGSELTLESVLPRLIPGMAGLAVRLAFIAGAAWLVTLRRSGRHGKSSSKQLQIALWGAVLLCLLPALFNAAGSKVAGLTEILVFTLIPAAVVFLTAQAESGFGAPGRSFGLLAPALAGMGGSALLIAYSLPGKPAGVVWLALMLLATVVTAHAIQRLHGLLQGVTIWRGLALIGTGGALLSAALCWVGWTPLQPLSVQLVAAEVGRLLLLDLPVILLTAWLLRVLPPAAFATRYLLVPFVAVAEAFLVARPSLDWSMFAGTALVLGGSFLLLRGAVPAEVSVVSQDTHTP